MTHKKIAGKGTTSVSNLLLSNIFCSNLINKDPNLPKNHILVETDSGKAKAGTGSELERSKLQQAFDHVIRWTVVATVDLDGLIFRTRLKLKRNYQNNHEVRIVENYNMQV